MSPRHRSGSVGRYLLAALIAGSIPVVVGVNGCDSNPVVQPDGSVPSDGGSAGKDGGSGGQAGAGAGSGGAGGQAGSAAGSGGAGGQAGSAAGSGGAGGQAGSAADSGGAGGQAGRGAGTGGQAGSASHSGGAGGVGGAGSQGGRGGAAGSGTGGAGGAPSQACLYAGMLSVEPVAGACCAVGVGSLPRWTKCTSDHMSLGTCFRSTNYEYLWQVQACPCTDGQGGAGGGSYCN